MLSCIYIFFLINNNYVIFMSGLLSTTYLIVLFPYRL